MTEWIEVIKLVVAVGAPLLSGYFGARFGVHKAARDKAHGEHNAIALDLYLALHQMLSADMLLVSSGLSMSMMGAAGARQKVGECAQKYLNSTLSIPARGKSEIRQRGERVDLHFDVVLLSKTTPPAPHYAVPTDQRVDPRSYMAPVLDKMRTLYPFLSDLQERADSFHRRLAEQMARQQLPPAKPDGDGGDDRGSGAS